MQAEEISSTTNVQTQFFRSVCFTTAARVKAAGRRELGVKVIGIPVFRRCLLGCTKTRYLRSTQLCADWNYKGSRPPSATFHKLLKNPPHPLSSTFLLSICMQLQNMVLVGTSLVRRTGSAPLGAVSGIRVHRAGSCRRCSYS